MMQVVDIVGEKMLNPQLLNFFVNKIYDMMNIGVNKIYMMQVVDLVGVNMICMILHLTHLDICILFI